MEDRGWQGPRSRSPRMPEVSTRAYDWQLEGEPGKQPRHGEGTSSGEPGESQELARCTRDTSARLSRCYGIRFVFSWYSLGVSLVFCPLFPGAARRPRRHSNGIAALALLSLERTTIASF